MSVHNSAGVGAAAAAAVVLCLPFETFERFHSWRPLKTLCYHVKWNSVLCHDLSQRECVGTSVTSACRLVCTVQE